MVEGHKHGRIWKETSYLLLVLTHITGEKKPKTSFHDLKMSHCIWKLSVLSVVSVCLIKDAASPHSSWFIYISRSAFLAITFLTQPFRKLMGK